MASSVFLITGAASGMGRLAAQRYARAGHKVVGLDLNEVGLEEAARGYSNLSTHVVDITSYDQVEAIVQAVEAEVGPITRLINCAGIMPLGTIASQDVRLMNKIMDVNFKGTMHVNKAVLPYMLGRRHGEIVNFASIAGWVPYLSYAAYDASKYAVVAFTEVLYHENKQNGLKVCCVCPPPVNTPLLNDAINVPKVLKMAPVVEPGFVIDSMENCLAQNKLFCFPGRANHLMYFVRRFLPNAMWRLVHLVEGSDFSDFSQQPENIQTPVKQPHKRVSKNRT